MSAPMEVYGIFKTLRFIAASKVITQAAVGTLAPVTMRALVVDSLCRSIAGQLPKVVNDPAEWATEDGGKRFETAVFALTPDQMIAVLTEAFNAGAGKKRIAQ